MEDAVEVRRLVAAARAELPRFDIEDDVLVAHVAAAGAPETLYVADLVLARACAAGDGAALAHFDRAFAPEMALALATFRAGQDFTDEVLQRVREKLFVASPPKILDYGGLGSLRSWLRAVVLRTALNARRRKVTDAAVSDDVLANVAAVVRDPTTVDLVARFGDVYKRAVHAALASLEPEERNLLRLSLLEGLGIDAIATMHGVHRATVARRIARAREAVAADSIERLGQATALPRTELASLTRACHSILDLSLVRALER